MRRVIVAALLAALVMVLAAPAALADPGATDLQRKIAAGWGCGADAGLPPGHCVNPGEGGGQTFLIMVYDEAGNFVSSEGATFKASADTRPCPNDPESPDGTWWQPGPPGLFVCHHQDFLA